MIQRLETRSPEDELHLAKHQLLPHFEQLAELSYETLSSSDSAQIIISMINELSNPHLVYLYQLRHTLAEAEFPYLAQYKMVFDKAQTFYLQSIIQDLNKIKNDEPLMQISKEEIRQCVEDINWKINVEHSSVLGKSQQVGDNIDLMKFFEGVRNYQNWNENIKRQALQRLKERAHTIELQLTLKQGFIISKIQKVVAESQRRFQGELFGIGKQRKNYIRNLSIFKRILNRKQSQSLESIKYQSELAQQKVLEMEVLMKKYVKKRLITDTRKIGVQIAYLKHNINRLIAGLVQLKRKHQTLLKVSVFKHLHTKPILKASNITTAVFRLNSLSQRVAVRHIIKHLNLPTKTIFDRLNSMYEDRVSSAFNEMRKNSIQAKLNRPNVSDWVKGKILVSLNKHEKEPISLKKTFDRWYLHTHEQYYSKKIYNIWLQGNISKFTFFMRLKNMCDNVNKQMISKEMNNLIKVLCEKYSKYESHNQKVMLTRWLQNTRRIRKIQAMFNLITSVTQQTKNMFQAYAVEKVIAFCRKRQMVKNYLNKYITAFIEKRKVAFNLWLNVNNLKKQWGRKRLRRILINVTNEMAALAKQSLNVLKENRLLGRQKKLKQCRRTINTDTLFMSTLFHFWRLKETTDKNQEQRRLKTLNDNKTKSLTKMDLLSNKVVSLNAKDIIFKFKQHKQIKAKKIAAVNNQLVKVVCLSNESLLKETLGGMIDCWREGKVKKDRLVTKLVHSNLVKEKLTLSILRNKSLHIKDLLRVEKCARICEILQQKIRQNMRIFNQKLFVYRILQKILSNRVANATQAFGLWKAMPLRMRWRLRQKVLKMNSVLRQLQNQRLNQCNTTFKNSLVQAKQKKKKGVYIMACKFEMLARKFFQKYHKNVVALKLEQKIQIVSKMFENMRRKTKDNMSIMMQAEAEWPKRQQSLLKLDQHLQKRIRSYFLSWHKNANAIAYCNKIVDEKKKRVLQNLNQLLLKDEIHRTRKAIQVMDKNRRIHNLQVNFLKKLCEGQAGKLQKSFMIWKSMPEVKNKERIINATNFSNNLNQMLKRNLKNTLSAFQRFRKQGLQKRYQSVNRLVACKCSQIGKFFHKWLLHKRLIELNIKNQRVEAAFDTFTKAQSASYSLLYTGDEAKNKIKSMEIIQQWWNEQKRYFIVKWHRNTVNLKMRDLNRRHILASISNIKRNQEKRTILSEVVARFRHNRQAKLQEKKKQKVQSIIRILQNEEAFKRTLLNETVDKFKYNHYRGNFLKNQAFHKFLRQKIGQVHQCLAIWNGLANHAKDTHKQRIVTTNFASVYESIRQNFNLVFARTRETLIKKNTLDRIFKATQIQFKAYFNLWRQRIKQLKILGEMDKQAKASILERINKIVSSTSTQAVIDTIKKFNMNYKIQKVQRKFIERLMQTKSGKVIHAFKEWKTIPYNQKMGKFKKYQRFYFDLENFYINRLKTVHSSFAQGHDDGNLMKKQSILKLFEMTSLGIRRFYNRWTRLTKEKHTLMQVHNTLRAFQSVEGALANQYQIIFQDQRAYKIKIAAINKLIEASRGTTQNYFNIWRENVRMINLENNMDKEKKKLALGIFNKVIGNSTTGQVINIINKFKTNATTTRVARNFFNRLMNTKTGKVIQFFEKLKTVPDAKMNKRKKRGIIFESRLHNFVQKRLRFALAPFKDSTYDANIKKKYCLDRLLRACMGENKKKFLIWRNVIRQGKILKHTELCQNIFANIENIYRNNFLVINKDTSSQIQKKKGLCRKLINNSNFVQHHAYLLWKEAYYLDDIKIKAKQNNTQSHLRNLFEIFREHNNKKTIQAIDVFRRLLESENIVQSNYYKDYMNQKCLEFYNALRTRELNHKIALISALKANRTEVALGQKSQNMLAVFQTIQRVVQGNMDYVMKTEDQTAFLRQSLEKLYQNQWFNMRATLSMWKVKKTAIEMMLDNKNQQKKQAILKLKYILELQKRDQVKFAIKQFEANLQIKNTKKKVCLKMFVSKSEKCRTLFANWKNLPYQQAKKTKTKATKFEKSLLQLLMNRLREAHSIFKKQGHQGIVKKQNAVRNIVRAKLIDIYSSFFKWRKSNNEDKVKEKIISLDRVFSSTQAVFRREFSIFENSKIQDQRKVHAVTQIFNRNVSRLREYVLIWRQSTRSIKLKLFDKYMRNFIPEDFNKKLLREGFLTLLKVKDMQAMKGYINSLWKWKMSNIQATYYSKFIKVFKESEEVAQLSNILNKKIYEHVHYGFRSILTVGAERSNRRRQILVKYLTKRLRNYFIAFKNSASTTEINVWRSKYTDSIKSKVIFDIFSTLILKSKFYAVNKIKGYYDYTGSIAKLQQVLSHYENNLLQEAFYKLKWSPHQNILALSARLFLAGKEGTLRECFGLLNNQRKLSLLQDKIQKAVNKNLIYQGFVKIHKKKQISIKSKLSIILLETLISNAQSEQKRKIIQCFNRNRIKNISADKLYKFLKSRYDVLARKLLDNSLVIMGLNRLLQQFKRGQAIQRIIEKQDQALKKKYLNRMRKRSNKWMQLAIQKFATRASLRSSPAISLWRLKTYVMNT